MFFSNIIRKNVDVDLVKELIDQSYESTKAILTKENNEVC